MLNPDIKKTQKKTKNIAHFQSIFATFTLKTPKLYKQQIFRSGTNSLLPQHQIYYLFYCYSFANIMWRKLDSW